MRIERGRAEPRVDRAVGSELTAENNHLIDGETSRLEIGICCQRLTQPAGVDSRFNATDGQMSLIRPLFPWKSSRGKTTGNRRLQLGQLVPLSADSHPKDPRTPHPWKYTNPSGAKRQGSTSPGSGSHDP